MPALVIFALSLLLAALCERSVAHNASRATRKFYVDVLGEQRVDAIFQASEVLHYAASVDKPGSLQFACADYAKGAAIAKEYRERPSAFNATLTPLVVDYESNRMCFLAISSTPSWEAPVGMTARNYLPALKIHDSAYSLIEHDLDIDIALEESDVSVYFRYEQFCLPNETLPKEVMIERHFKMQFEKLAFYGTEQYDQFFWSAVETSKFMDQVDWGAVEMPQKVVLDMIRQKHWSSLREEFASLGNKGSRMDYGFYDDKDRDPCRYEDMFNSAEFTEMSVRLPTQSFAEIEGDQLRDSCLANVLLMFANQPSVHFVSVDPRPSLLNFRARSITQSAKVGSTMSYMPYTEAGLRGDGEVITIADTGLDSYSCYFYDSQGRVTPTKMGTPNVNTKYRKVIQYQYGGCGDQSDAEGGHGTHVAGIAVGNILNKDITGEGKYDGVAPNAKVSIADLAKPGGGLCIPPVAQLYGGGREAGAKIFSNSWGTYFTGSGYYYGQDLDAYLYRITDTAVFFAAGNIGEERTATRESSAKNVISVGSSETTFGSTDISYVAFYSSYGPTYDNRFKPDIVSPGDSLNSADASGRNVQTCNTIQMTGTSMACPSAAGVALLVRQYFQDTRNRFWTAICRSSYRSCKPFSPSGVLIKAILVHSGESMSLFHGGGSYDVRLGAAPDNIQGFGRVDLPNVLPLKDTKNFDLFVADMVNVMEDSEVGYDVQVTSSNYPISITIAWYDTPNSQGSTSKALLNDLDLYLVDPRGRKYYPNRRNSADSVNTVERIQVDNPAHGLWRVRVRCRSLPTTGNQLFAIVITSKGTVIYT